jgi:hypothetical protein
LKAGALTFSLQLHSSLLPCEPPFTPSLVDCVLAWNCILWIASPLRSLPPTTPLVVVALASIDPPASPFSHRSPPSLPPSRSHAAEGDSQHWHGLTEKVPVCGSPRHLRKRTVSLTALLVSGRRLASFASEHYVGRAGQCLQQPDPGTSLIPATKITDYQTSQALPFAILPLIRALAPWSGSFIPLLNQPDDAADDHIVHVQPPRSATSL